MPRGIGHERLDVFVTAAWLVQRILQEHVGSRQFIDDVQLHVLPQKSVNQRPTMALFSLSLDMIVFSSWRSVASRTLGGDRVWQTPVLAAVSIKQALRIGQRRAAA